MLRSVGTAYPSQDPADYALFDEISAWNAEAEAFAKGESPVNPYSASAPASSTSSSFSAWLRKNSTSVYLGAAALVVLAFMSRNRF